MTLALLHGIRAWRFLFLQYMKRKYSLPFLCLFDFIFSPLFFIPLPHSQPLDHRNQLGVPRGIQPFPGHSPDLICLLPDHLDSRAFPVNSSGLKGHSKRSNPAYRLDHEAHQVSKPYDRKSARLLGLDQRTWRPARSVEGKGDHV